MKIKTALILCAGYGKRLNPLTLKTPKPLLRFKNLTMLDHTIDFIENLGIEKIKINTFYLENPVGEISFGKDKYFLSGKDGIYEKDIQKLKINGDVKFKNQNDMSFSTTEVFFDFKDQILFGDKTVHGIKNNSTITSQGIKVYNKENKIIFTGKTKLLLANEK